MVDLDTLVVGDTISFKSINPQDNVLWQGILTGICAYSVVQNMRTDLVPYYRAVKKLLPTMEPIEELTFFTFKIYQDGKSSTLIMAKVWIEPTSVQKIEINKMFDVRIYDLDAANATTVLNLLTANGFKVGLVES